MPQLGETVTEGTITKWFKAVGDTVARDEPLFEVSTDKVDSEVPSPADGVLTAILVEEGDTVDVGVALAVIDGDACAPRRTGDGTRRRAPLPATAARRASRRRPPAPAAAPARGLPDEPVPSAPPAATARRTGRPAGAGTAAAPRPPRALPTVPAGADQARVLSPVVRKLLADHAIDPSTIRGTGLEGRITRADVEAVIERGGPPAAVPEHRRRDRTTPRGPVGRAATAPARPRRHAARATACVPATGTRWSRSPTSAGARPSTWSARRRRPPTR